MKNKCPFLSLGCYCSHKRGVLRSKVRKLPKCVYANEKKCDLYKDSRSKLKSASESFPELPEPILEVVHEKESDA